MPDFDFRVDGGSSSLLPSLARADVSSQSQVSAVIPTKYVGLFCAEVSTVLTITHSTVSRQRGLRLLCTARQN